MSFIGKDHVCTIKKMLFTVSLNYQHLFNLTENEVLSIVVLLCIVTMVMYILTVWLSSIDIICEIRILFYHL